MAISEFEIKRCERELEKFLSVYRPPAHMRAQLDLCYRIVNQSVEIFEITPSWRNPEEKIESPVAKCTYVKSKKLWKLFWYKSDMKWHGYDPVPEASTLEGLLSVIGEDDNCCFFG
ncbi:MAG: hypothetical protein ACI9VI_003472 [Candidatus Azotimanducaceae bacterium]|jgi:hypothetical protein